MRVYIRIPLLLLISSSTFVGCPDERRPHTQHMGRGHRSRWSSRNKSNEFSLFDLLDVNRGPEVGTGTSDSDDEDRPSVAKTESDSCNSPDLTESRSQSTITSGHSAVTSAVPSTSLFSVLFDSAASASKTFDDQNPALETSDVERLSPNPTSVNLLPSISRRGDSAFFESTLP